MLPLAIDPQVLQLIVILGPVVLSVLLGPLLVALVNRAKTKAEAESFEVISDKARFEAMDLLVKNLRDEATLAAERTKEAREETAQCKQRNRALEDQILFDERLIKEAIRWGLTLYADLIGLGLDPADPPVSIQSLVEDRDLDSRRVLKPKPKPKRLP